MASNSTVAIAVAAAAAATVASQPETVQIDTPTGTTSHSQPSQLQQQTNNLPPRIPARVYYGQPIRHSRNLSSSNGIHFPLAMNIIDQGNSSTNGANTGSAAAAPAAAPTPAVHGSSVVSRSSTFGARAPSLISRVSGLFFSPVIASNTDSEDPATAPTGNSTASSSSSTNTGSSSGGTVAGGIVSGDATFANGTARVSSLMLSDGRIPSLEHILDTPLPRNASLELPTSRQLATNASLSAVLAHALHQQQQQQHHQRNHAPGQDQDQEDNSDADSQRTAIPPSPTSAEPAPITIIVVGSETIDHLPTASASSRNNVSARSPIDDLRMPAPPAAAVTTNSHVDIVNDYYGGMPFNYSVSQQSISATRESLFGNSSSRQHQHSRSVSSAMATINSVPAPITTADGVETAAGSSSAVDGEHGSAGTSSNRVSGISAGVRRSLQRLSLSASMVTRTSTIVARPLSGRGSFFFNAIFPGGGTNDDGRNNNNNNNNNNNSDARSTRTTRTGRSNQTGRSTLRSGLSWDDLCLILPPHTLDRLRELREANERGQFYILWLVRFSLLITIALLVVALNPSSRQAWITFIPLALLLGCMFSAAFIKHRMNVREKQQQQIIRDHEHLCFEGSAISRANSRNIMTGDGGDGMSSIVPYMGVHMLPSTGAITTTGGLGTSRPGSIFTTTTALASFPIAATNGSTGLNDLARRRSNPGSIHGLQARSQCVGY
ncbi:hypothetical protein GQ42DRAFT_158392 [Ramicandelaber brevisporus]|nr:hypothetical protein GQ42DRAFT_158392 [Ramicandelaber brevisporus]